MKIHRACVLVIFTLLASHSARAANWAVGWAFNAQLNAYRTVTEHWNGTRWALVRSPKATNGYNLLNGVVAHWRKTIRVSGAALHEN